MEQSLLNLSDLVWYSDWNGNEVGYDNVPVVGLYGLKINPNILFYIDTEKGVILEAWGENDD